MRESLNVASRPPDGAHFNKLFMTKFVLICQLGSSDANFLLDLDALSMRHPPAHALLPHRFHCALPFADYVSSLADFLTSTLTFF